MPLVCFGRLLHDWGKRRFRNPTWQASPQHAWPRHQSRVLSRSALARHHQNQTFSICLRPKQELNQIRSRLLCRHTMKVNFRLWSRLPTLHPLKRLLIHIQRWRRRAIDGGTCGLGLRSNFKVIDSGPTGFDLCGRKALFFFYFFVGSHRPRSARNLLPKLFLLSAQASWFSGCHWLKTRLSPQGLVLSEEALSSGPRL